MQFKSVKHEGYTGVVERRVFCKMLWSLQLCSQNKGYIWLPQEKLYPNDCIILESHFNKNKDLFHFVKNVS